tara:strand:- start:2458 stop:2730 length:273 start_codon:yes stop_codon:yes gene_type:complete
MPVRKNSYNIDPVDVQIGGDADLGGIAQTITADDIDAVLMSPAPIEDRLESLTAMRGELEARSHVDRGNEMEPLISQIDGGIALLSMGRV